MSMDQNDPAVKSRRRYDARGRRAQAQRSRATIVDVARRMFLANGYAATTVAAIAADAGVSVETIYKAFGGKSGLVRAIRDQALEGAGPTPAEQRSNELQATEQDPRTVIRGWGALTTEVAPQVAPILLLVRDAASDPEMARLQAELDEQRLARMTHNAQTLADGGHLRDELTVERAAELMWTYTAPELYELLVRKRGWPPERFGAFVADALIAALLPPEPILRPRDHPQADPQPRDPPSADPQEPSRAGS
jgi:AcrR family transcriptional regulator